MLSLMVQPLRKYAVFDGRARRSEFWLFALFQLLALAASVVVALLLVSIPTEDRNVGGYVVLGWFLFLVVFTLVTLLPGLAVMVRRLHDANFTGWLVLIQLLPFGGLVLLVFALIEGTKGPNSYGADPRVDEGGLIVESFS